MSRHHARERKKRALFDQRRTEFARVRSDSAALAVFVTRLAASGDPVWPVAQAGAGDRPLDDDERAMVSQAVAPHLTGGTSGVAERRHRMAPGGGP